jgi:UDP-N-acetylmuramoyl-L-alanyl-D-glutamate--2,6-diaminopimelate ligase
MINPKKDNHYPAPLMIHQVESHLKKLGLLSHSTLSTPEEMLADVTIDSRKVKPGDMFIAISGFELDGHNYISNALSLGAKLIISEKPIAGISNVLVVKSSRFAWAHIEDLRYGHPGGELKIIGFTGTNGKTSTAWMGSHLLDQLGKSNLMLGTLGIKWQGRLEATSHTTVDPDQLYKWLRLAVSEGVEYVLMEVSSHSLSQGKVDPLRFFGAVWISFSRDHLDFHQTMARYLEAKVSLFSLVREDGFSLIHSDILKDYPEALELLEVFKYDTCALSQAKKGFFFLDRCLHYEKDGLSLKVQSPYVGPLLNSNLVAAIKSITALLGENISTVFSQVAHLPQVPGRFEFVGYGSGESKVFVEYAHTPDAIVKACQSIKADFPNCRLRLLIGCGGERDRGKRPLMAEAAAQEAEVIYFTSDNPRREDPEQILKDMLSGNLGTKIPVVILDREEAIKKAIGDLIDGCILLISGKGHETYQQIGTEKISFDDRVVARKYLKN